jgi:hypothetical protein
MVKSTLTRIFIIKKLKTVTIVERAKRNQNPHKLHVILPNGDVR